MHADVGTHTSGGPPLEPPLRLPEGQPHHSPGRMPGTPAGNEPHHPRACRRHATSSSDTHNKRMMWLPFREHSCILPSLPQRFSLGYDVARLQRAPLSSTRPRRRGHRPRPRPRSRRPYSSTDASSFGGRGRISVLVHCGIGSHVGQAFLPDPVGQECPTYWASDHRCTKTEMRPWRQAGFLYFPQRWPV